MHYLKKLLLYYILYLFTCFNNNNNNLYNRTTCIVCDFKLVWIYDTMRAYLLLFCLFIYLHVIQRARMQNCRKIFSFGSTAQFGLVWACESVIVRFFGLKCGQIKHNSVGILRVAWCYWIVLIDYVDKVRFWVLHVFNFSNFNYHAVQAPPNLNTHSALFLCNAHFFF